MSGRVYYPAARVILQVVFDGFGDESKDSKPFVIPVLPKAVTVHRNSYRQADSWQITFEANDLPIDPHQVRAGAAEIYLFQTPGIVDEQRVVSRQFATTDDESADKARTSIEALQKEFAVKASRDRFTFNNPPMVVGRFDQHDMELSSDGKWVTISGQDYTALLASKQWPPTAKHTARKIPVGKRLDRQIAAILAEADTAGVLSLKREGVAASDWPTVGHGEVNAVKLGIPVEESTSYWDVMYKLATRYGFVLFVRGLDVVLTKPKSIDMATANPKLLAWGNNVESLRLSRRLGKEKAPRIVVIGCDQKNRQRIIAEYPNTGLRSKRPTLKGKLADRSTSVERTQATGDRPRKGAPLKVDDEYQIVTAFDVGDPVALRRIAETRYHLIASGERTVVAVTRDLKDMRESSLMDLSAGDAVEVEWGDFNREIIANPNLGEDAKYQHLIERGFNSEVAKAIAENYTKMLGQKRPMRVREATYEYSVDDGIRVEMELRDFATVDGSRREPRNEAASKKRTDKLRRSSGERIGNPLVDGGGA